MRSAADDAQCCGPQHSAVLMRSAADRSIAAVLIGAGDVSGNAARTRHARRKAARASGPAPPFAPSLVLRHTCALLQCKNTHTQFWVVHRAQLSSGNRANNNKNRRKRYTVGARISRRISASHFYLTMLAQQAGTCRWRVRRTEGFSEMEWRAKATKTCSKAKPRPRAEFWYTRTKFKSARCLRTARCLVSEHLLCTHKTKPSRTGCASRTHTHIHSTCT